MERVQKLLARAGVASRRESEKLIKQGRITVDGKPAELGSKANPATQQLCLDGRPLLLHQSRHYLALHKPAGYLSSRRDPQGRPTVMDLIPRHLHRLVYPVGRLDADAEGLLFLFDDGELAHALTHPSHEVPKTYQALVAGSVGPTALRTLRHGLPLAEGMTAPAHAKVLARYPDSTLLEITVHEGRKRQVKRMCAVVGHPVRQLVRVSIGGVELGRLAPGSWRDLTEAELRRLRALAHRGVQGARNDRAQP